MTRKEKMLEFVDEGYNISVTGRHVHVTESMKQYAREKIAKLERLGDRIIDVAVTMDIQKLEHRVDIVMKYAHTIIKSQGSTNDMYISIDQAVAKLETQLKKYLDRIHHHHMKSYPVIDLPVTVYERGGEGDDIGIINHEIEEAIKVKRQKEMQLPSIVSKETTPLKILTDEEAIMKMDLCDKEVLLYKDEASRKLKVIYRRDDGNYGVIEPE